MIGKPTQMLAAEDGYAGFLSSYGTRDRVVYAGSNAGLIRTGSRPLWCRYTARWRPMMSWQRHSPPGSRRDLTLP